MLKRLKETILRIPHSAFALLALYLLSGIYFVAPEQQVVVTRFNRVVAKGITPGIHYSLPWPIERVEKLKVLETKRLTIGVEMPDQVLGRTAAENPVQYLTGNQNIIAVQMAVQYAISDAAAYLYHSQEVTQMIATAVESAFAQTIAAESVDNILTTGKIVVQNTTLAKAREILDGYRSGVHLNSINLESLTPPTEVADAFREVASARADRDRTINEAQGYASNTVAKAQGEADKLRSEAESFRQQRINEATGDAAREGDANAYLNCFSGALRQNLDKTAAEMGEAKFKAYLQQRNAEVTGIAVSDLEQPDAQTAALRVEFVYRGKSEVQKHHFKLINGQRQIARVDGGEQISLPTPSSTVVAETK